MVRNSPAAAQPPQPATFENKEEALKAVPRLRSAFLQQQVTFGDLFDSRYALRPPPPPDTASETKIETAALAYLHWPIRDLFEKTYGSIQQEFWCSALRAAAVVTVRSPASETGAKFHVIANWEQDDAPFAEQMTALDDLELGTRFLPDGITRTSSIRLIYEAYACALDAIDRRRLQHLHDQKVDLKLVAQQLDRARKFFKAAGTRYAQGEYLRGMFIGFIVVLAAAYFLGFLNFVRGATSDAIGPRLIFWGLAGAIGAPLSVLVRITQEDFRLNWEASREELWTAGAIRPLVGAVLGAAVPLLVIGGLAAITTSVTDTNDLKSGALYLSLALAAGFSERWAPDLIAKQPAILGSGPGTGGSQTEASSGGGTGSP